MQSIPFQFSHGGYIKEKEVEGTGTRAIDVETDFDYLFPELAKDPNSLLPATNTKDTIAKLKALGDAMIDSTDFSAPLPPQAPISSTIPPVFTYWGQFIDHDITANTDRTAQDLKTDITNEDFKPLPPSTVIEKLKNLRRPTFDLDSVYGDGPTLDPSQKPTEAKNFYQEKDPVKLKVGQATDDPSIPGVKIPPEGDLMRDLPRDENKRAIIGDSRNDENLIVAQFHVAFLRFHNAVVDWVRANEPENAKDNRTLFNRAQQLVRWHYQWLVINDFLKTLTVKGTVDSILTGGLKFYKLRNGELFMPLEFSVAAYRFGHSLIRGAYDHNRNFTDRDTPSRVANSTFDLLFLFTGKGGLGGNPTLPFNWIIEWNRFADKGRASIRGRNSARRIDTRLTKFLSDMQNEIDPAKTQAINDLLKHLAKRNLLRGYFLSIPTGQSLADKLGVKRLTSEELQRRNSPQMNQALAPFLEKTPAWYYILKESEIRANGDSLGEVGSRIVAETFIGLMRNDNNSFLSQDWDPSQGVKLPNGKEIRQIADLLKFAGVMV
ncbi:MULTISPECIES: peroxidase family protein [Nostocales]|uniref:Peroxidase n=3 Tax=Nostocales TaxID=1161 RepID=A0A8S9SUX1_9CYAN|nr:heme peroxidase family protein [Tolypothrix bouteillei]KAF3883836.1 hypothetical protein DA73_0400039705 [Tolypothrix bouteillei VB521301]